MQSLLHLKTFFKNHLILFIFIALYFCFSLLTYKVYPIANGEEYRYLRGKETLEHYLYGQFTEKMLQPVPNYFLYNIYPLILVALNPNFYYEWFHLFNLLFSVVSFVAVYFLAHQLSQSKKVALYTLFALFLFPRFIGELAINPVDMPFMVFYLVTLLVLLRFSNRSLDHWSTLLIGVLIGLSQGIRQLGLTLYILMILLDTYDYYFTKEKSLKEFLSSRLLKYVHITIIAFFFMLVTWPNYAVNFFKSTHWYLFVGSNFYLWDFGLLFFGKFLENFERPWYYLSFFQLISYPIYILVGFLLSLKFVKNKLKNRTYFLILSALLINYALYLILHPVLYDGIRHFLFMVPLVVLLAIDAIYTFISTHKNWALKCILMLLISIELVFIAKFCIKEFPYIYPYFNKIAYIFGNPYKLFESDYANTKYRAASEWLRDVYIAEHPEYQTQDTQKMLKVFACDNAYAVDYFSHKKFLTVINKEEADLVVCDYRNLLQSGYQGTTVKTFSINDQEILYLLKLSAPI